MSREKISARPRVRDAAHRRARRAARGAQERVTMEEEKEQAGKRRPFGCLDCPPLWQRLDEAVANHQVEWHWVKGHSGHRENEIVDEAANAAIDAMQEA